MVDVLRSTAFPFSPSKDLVGKVEANGSDGSDGKVGLDMTAARTGREIRRLDSSVGDGQMPAVQQQRPAPFDGKTSWDAYLAQFEVLAQVSHWSNPEKAAYLAISLRGPAATVLTNLPRDQHRNYESLVSALET